MEVGQREFRLRGGRIILHTRAEDSQGIWQCRMRLGADRKLVRRSTRTADLEEAKRTAEELYEELRFKHRGKQPLKARTFRRVAGDFLRKAERDKYTAWGANAVAPHAPRLIPVAFESQGRWGPALVHELRRVAKHRAATVPEGGPTQK